MRSSPKTYATLLLRLVASAEHEEDLEKRLDTFLRYVEARHDIHLLKRALRLFNEKFIETYGLQRFDVEFASVKDREDSMKELEQRFDAKTAVFTGRVNSKLISGVRIIHNDTHLIDSSFDGLVYQLLKSF